MSGKANGKVAIVTGGGRGLGAAMALGLARAGYRVVVTAAREAAEIEAIAAEAGGDWVYPLVADVTREEDCQRVVEAALARFGSLDILVNNAGRGMKYISSSFMTEPTRFWEAEWMASAASDGITGRRLVANRWHIDVDDGTAAQSALGDAGWARP
jgi:NAD(P)-dependent dehydrogenase (short-subunit alcohol dehydrogenase family)